MEMENNEHHVTERKTFQRRTLYVSVRGFVLWIASFIVGVLYLLWAYTPETILLKYDITFYPDRFWAVGFSAWITMTIVYVVAGYSLYNLMKTHDLTSMFTLTDRSHRDQIIKDVPSSPYGIPDMFDVPIMDVNKVYLA